MINTIFSTRHATGRDEEKGRKKKGGDFPSEVLAQPELPQPRPFIISRLDSGTRPLGCSRGTWGSRKVSWRWNAAGEEPGAVCMRGESDDFGVSPREGSGTWL